MKKRGFTLIELIVVMAIISILILLGLPKYREYTEEARITRLKVEVKELEKASQQYYMRNSDWPRLTDEPYTSEEVIAFSDKIRDETGEVVVLDSEGNYYDIDYAKLSNYMTKPSNPKNYILQNPVGSVFYLEKLTEDGKLRVDYGDLEEVPGKTYKDVIFYGLSPEAFDGDINTFYSFNNLQTITWEGDLNNREITVVAKGVYYNYNYPMYIRFIDANGNKLAPIGENTNNVLLSLNNGVVTKKIIVPKEAVKIEVDMNNLYKHNGAIYEISVAESLELPKPVSNISYTSTDSSITLNWEQNESSYEKIALYRNNAFLCYVNGFTYTDKPLYSNTEYTYTLIAINNYGNAGEVVTYKAKTNEPDIVFHGLSPAAFDSDTSTPYNFNNLQTITWDGDLDNKEITLVAKGVYYNSHYNMYIRFIDINGTRLVPIGEKTNNVLLANGSLTTKKLIVPKGTVKIEVDMNNLYKHNGAIYEISVTENLELPNSVSNVTYTSTNSSITLNWEQKDSNYSKVAIFRDGVFLTYINSYSFTDQPLYADSEHTYDIIAINNYGNASEKVTLKARTTKPDVVFRGLTPEVFDGDTNTSYAFNSLKTITWEGNLDNRELTIIAKGVYYNKHYNMYIRFIDINGTRLVPPGQSSNNIVLANGSLTTKKIIVPEGTVKIEVDMNNLYKHNGAIYEISVTN